MLEVIEHSLLDTWEVFPFLFIVFIAISLLERRVPAAKYKSALGGKVTHLVGAGLGVIPQCGVSAMAAKLFHEGCITVGALLSVFLSSSDEGVALLVGYGKWKEFLILAAVRFVVALAVGYAADAIVGRRKREPASAESEFETCHHTHGKDESAFHAYFVHPLLHCLKTAAFVLVVNFLLRTVIYLVGEDKFNAFLTGAGYLQPVVCALVGLIPNCGASVLLVGVYRTGSLTFGGLAAGLIANAGVGLALLFKHKGGILTALAVVAVMFVTGAAVGGAITAICAAF